MRKKLSFSFILLAVILAVNTNGQNVVKVNRLNQEQTIYLTAGQVLEISLPRKATTGYTWRESNATAASTKSIAKIGDDDFISDAVSGQTIKRKTVGGSGTQIVRYVGTSQGTTVLNLELKRQWDKKSSVIDSYTITVVSEGKYTGDYKPAVKNIHKYDKPLTSKVTQIPGIPTSFDWRSHCTPIKDQQQCGDCWAYASVGTLECNILIHDGITRVISEEFVTDCYTDNGCNGCTGGSCAHQAWMSSYYGANYDGGGAVYECDDSTTCNFYGYTGYCNGAYTPHDTINNYADIGGEDFNGVPSVDSIKYYIYNYGPVWVAMDASSSNFNGYSGGIFVETGTATDHAIVLAGWVDTTVADGSGGYWILRNSWGTGWGIDGYMYISYGSDFVGCDADYIVYKGGVPHTGFNAYASNKNISVYPNPANDIITIENNAFAKNQTMSVYDTRGQLLMQQPVFQAKTNLDISLFSKGIYFLKVENESGVTIKKFIKE